MDAPDPETSAAWGRRIEDHSTESLSQDTAVSADGRRMKPGMNAPVKHGLTGRLHGRNRFPISNRHNRDPNGSELGWPDLYFQRPGERLSLCACTAAASPRRPWGFTADPLSLKMTNIRTRRELTS